MTELVFYSNDGAEGGYVFHGDDEFLSVVADAAEETLLLLNVDEDDDPEVYAVDRAAIINNALLALRRGDTYRDQAGFTWKVESND
jgi:hypothetical protein